MVSLGDVELARGLDLSDEVDSAAVISWMTCSATRGRSSE